MKQLDFTAEIAASFLEKKGITDVDVMPAFATISGNSRVSFVAVTDVSVAAASKKQGIKIQKASVVNCAVYAGLKPDTNPYLNKLLKAGKLEHELKENWFYHYNRIFSLVAKKSDSEVKYLYTLPETGKSFFFVNGILVDKKEIFQYLTPSEVKKLTTKVEYDVCRVYALSSIKQITCLGDIITA